MDLKPCSSHMPVLMDLLKTFNFPNIVEFGSGLFSTNLFLGHTSSFTSVETYHEWMETVQQRFLGRTWKYVWAPDLPALLAEVRPCDLIFVDGHFRQEITQKAFTCAPVIGMKRTANWAPRFTMLSQPGILSGRRGWLKRPGRG